MGKRKSHYDEPTNRHERLEVWLSDYIFDWWERIGWGFGSIVSAAIIVLVIAAVVAEYV